MKNVGSPTCAWRATAAPLLRQAQNKARNPEQNQRIVTAHAARGHSKGGGFNDWFKGFS
jgi:hypothetical protein